MATSTEVRPDIVKQIDAYFRSPQWQALEDYVENKSDTTFHAHIFVDTTLHPLSFCDVLRAYHRARKMEIDRPIDLQPSNVGYNMLHGVHPSGSFHYDLAWRYQPGIIISPMPPEFIKEKNNMQTWGVVEIEEYFSQYPFITLDTKTNMDLEGLFTTDFWKQTCTYVRDDTIAHFHANVEMSVHPDDLLQAALAAIAKEGWTVQRAFHCLFSPVKGWTAGKVVFLLDEPRVMFDIAWKFCADTAIRPSTTSFMMPDTTQFDVRRKESIDFFTDKGEFVTLTDAELAKIGDAFAAHP